MGEYQINPEYKIEKVEIKLAEMAMVTFHLLDENIKMVSDGVGAERVFSLHLVDFINKYDEAHKKGLEIDPNNPVMPEIIHDREDLFGLQKNIQDISRLLDETQGKYPMSEYPNYSNSLKRILKEVEHDLDSFNGNGDGDKERMAA